MKKVPLHQMLSSASVYLTWGEKTQLGRCLGWVMSLGEPWQASQAGESVFSEELICLGRCSCCSVAPLALTLPLLSTTATTPSSSLNFTNNFFPGNSRQNCCVCCVVYVYMVVFVVYMCMCTCVCVFYYSLPSSFETGSQSVPQPDSNLTLAHSASQCWDHGLLLLFFNLVFDFKGLKSRHCGC